MTVLDRFLELAGCARCGGTLKYTKSYLQCMNNIRHRYRTNAYGFYEFGEKRVQDKYESDPYVREYVAVAYGYRLVNLATKPSFVGCGQSEGLYRSILQIGTSALLRNLSCEESINILDLGCGVGRLIAEMAIQFPKAFTVGLDYSKQMIRYARDILLSKGTIKIDLSHCGFGKAAMTRFGLSNVFLAQANAAYLPVRKDRSEKQGYDLVFNSMLIDRIGSSKQVQKCISQSARALRLGGSLVFACPFNWHLSETWRRFGYERYSIIDLLTSCGLSVDLVFDGLVYRELLDPHGAIMELPVLVLRANKIAII